MKKKQPPQLNGLSGSLTHFCQLGALLLRKGVKCHSPILQLFSASTSFVFFIFFFIFQLYMYLFGYDFNNLKQRQAEYFFFIEILTSVLTIQSSISQFEFLFEQLSAIKLFQCFHFFIQMIVEPFLRNNTSAVMFFQRFIFPAKTLWEKYSERIWLFHCR